MKSLFILCPECGTRLEVDPETGEILSVQKKKITDKVSLEDRLQELKKEKEASEEIFSQQLKSMKEREKLLEEKFKRALQESKEKEDEEPPLREIDLD